MEFSIKLPPGNHYTRRSITFGLKQRRLWTHNNSMIKYVWCTCVYKSEKSKCIVRCNKLIVNDIWTLIKYKNRMSININLLPDIEYMTDEDWFTWRQLVSSILNFFTKFFFLIFIYTKPVFMTIMMWYFLSVIKINLVPFILLLYDCKLSPITIK